MPKSSPDGVLDNVFQVHLNEIYSINRTELE